MGLNISYIADDRSLTFRLSMSDLEILENLSKEGFKEDVDAVVGVSDYGKEETIAHFVLLQSINKLLGSLGNERDLLPYTYLLEEKINTMKGEINSSGTGCISGLKIEGELYSIESGLDNCVLSKKKCGKDKRWYFCEPKDVRHLKEIKTDNLGVIKIIKKRKATSLQKMLKQLLEFLSNAESPTVTKILG